MWYIMFHMYSPRDKSFQTCIFPITGHSHPFPRLNIHCSKIVSTNHPIKIKHFHMLFTKFIYCINTDVTN